MGNLKRQYTYRMEVREERPVQGNAKGTTSVGTGRMVPVTIEVEVDIDAIARALYDRVARSKTGKCRYMGGKVKVTAARPRPALLIKQAAAPPVPPPDRAPSTRHIDLP